MGPLVPPFSIFVQPLHIHIGSESILLLAKPNSYGKYTTGLGTISELSTNKFGAKY